MRKIFLPLIGITALFGAAVNVSAQDYDPDRPFGVLHRDAYADGSLKPRTAAEEAVRRGQNLNMPAFLDMSDRRVGLNALFRPDDPDKFSRARHHVLGRAQGEGQDGYGDKEGNWDAGWGRPMEQSLLSLMGATFVQNINRTTTLAVDGSLKAVNGSPFDFDRGLLGVGAIDGAVGLVRVADNQYRATILIPKRLFVSQLKNVMGNDKVGTVYATARRTGERGVAHSGGGALNLLGFGVGLNLFDVSLTDFASADSVVVSVPEGSDVLLTVTDGKGGASAVAFGAGGTGFGMEWVAGGGAFVPGVALPSDWQRMGLGGISGGVHSGWNNGQVAGFPTFPIVGIAGDGSGSSGNNSIGGSGVTGIAGAGGNGGNIGGFSMVPEGRTITLLCFGLLGFLPFVRRKARQ
jgi:hypothetical protein